MSELSVSAERLIGAPAEHTYRYIADSRTHHPRFLPPAFSDFQVEQGGVGAGTVHSFRLTAGGRTRTYRMRVDEPEARLDRSARTTPPEARLSRTAGRRGATVRQAVGVAY